MLVRLDNMDISPERTKTRAQTKTSMLMFMTQTISIIGTKTVMKSFAFKVKTSQVNSDATNTHAFEMMNFRRMKERFMWKPNPCKRIRPKRNCSKSRLLLWLKRKQISIDVVSSFSNFSQWLNFCARFYTNFVYIFKFIRFSQQTNPVSSFHENKKHIE